MLDLHLQGGVLTFGDAAFLGDVSHLTLAEPVLDPTPRHPAPGLLHGRLRRRDLAFSADFKGSMGAAKLNRPVTGMVRAGTGYLLVGEDGSIFDFSGDPNSFKGSLGANPPARPIVAVAVLDV